MTQTEVDKAPPRRTGVTDLKRGRADDRKPVHDEKITFYCTFEELTRLEESRLQLRREFGIVTDRGGLIRAAIDAALDDVARSGKTSSVIKRLADRQRDR